MRTTVRLLKQWTYDERNKKEEKQFRVRRHRNMFFAQTVSQTGIIQQYQSITSSPFARFITSGSQSTAYISPLAYGKSFSKNYEFQTVRQKLRHLIRSLDHCATSTQSRSNTQWTWKKAQTTFAIEDFHTNHVFNSLHRINGCVGSTFVSCASFALHFPIQCLSFSLHLVGGVPRFGYTSL